MYHEAAKIAIVRSHWHGPTNVVVVVSLSHCTSTIRLEAESLAIVGTRLTLCFWIAPL